MKKILWSLILAAVIGLGVWLIFWLRPPQPFTLHVGRETTYFSGPVTRDGKIDYVRAWNEEAGREANAENNAVVLLAQAFGSNAYSEAELKLLGVATPTPSSVWTSFKEFSSASEGESARQSSVLGAEAAASHVQDQSHEKTLGPATVSPQPSSPVETGLGLLERTDPWTVEDSPLFSRWIASIGPALELVEHASQRPRYYLPVTSESLLEDLPRSPAFILLVSKALSARAMLRLSAHETKAAWRDVLTLYRLGALLQQDKRAIHEIMGCQFTERASRVALAIVRFGNLEPSEARRMRQELHSTAPVPRKKKIGLVPRLVALESLMEAAPAIPNTPAASGAGARFRSPLDVDSMLREINKFYDQLDNANDLPTFAMRSSARRDMEKRLVQPAVTPNVSNSLAYFLSTSNQRQEHLSHLMAMNVLSLTMPAFGYVDRTLEDTRAHKLIAEVALALEEYRGERHAFPDSLDALTPRFLLAPPADPYAPAILRYKKQESGYLLYSVGPNGVDDGGVSREVDTHNYDIVVSRR